MSDSRHLWLDGDNTDGRVLGAAPVSDHETPERPHDAHEYSFPPQTPVEPPKSRWPGRLLSAVAGGFIAGAIVLGVLGLTGNLDGTTTVTEEEPPAVASAGGVSEKDRGKVGAIYDAASPATVSVRTGQGGGTGFLVDDDGLIVTNAHVVEGEDSVQIQVDAKPQLVSATVLGTDTSSDLAVLRVDADSVDGIKPLPLADSDAVDVGDLAVAIGSPFGLDQTATAGIVSATGREISAPDGFSIDEVIQTDAPINPGNSGGPLLDARGRVIGVNSQIRGGAGGNVGIGFSVPANTVRDVLPALREGRPVEHAYLGISTAPASANGGARVGEVKGNTPASNAGIRVGDVILEVGGRTVREPADVGDVIRDRKPGDKIELKVERSGGDEETVTVTLGTRPASSGSSGSQGGGGGGGGQPQPGLPQIP